MKNTLTSLAFICIAFFVTTFILKSYNSNKNGITNNKTFDKETASNSSIATDSSSLDFSETLANYDTWKTYYKENIELTTDFIAIDVSGDEISKKTFLEKLKTGNYVPVKLYDAEYMYQLYKIKDDNDEKISKSVKRSANTIYSYFLKENAAFPEFNFEDLNGNLYTSDNTKGKTIVIECWFVQCTQCIAELPEINALYDRYEVFDDIIFLGLAFDNPEKLKKFLIKKEFRYSVVANQKDFIKNEIEVLQYPTHIIVDQYGDIKKMVNSIEALTLALDTMLNTDLPDEM